MNKKIIVMILSVVMFVSCIPTNKPKKKKKKKADEKIEEINSFHEKNVILENNNKVEPTPIEEGKPFESKTMAPTQNVEVSVAIKMFNQYNQTLSYLTKIPVDDEDIFEEYNSIRGQLPSGNNIKSYSSFNQLAYTRLSFIYCDKFVNTNQKFNSYNYRTISYITIRNELLNYFMDSDPSDIKDYENLVMNLDAILTNKDSLLPNSNLKNSTIMGCSALLSSAYFTTI